MGFTNEISEISGMEDLLKDRIKYIIEKYQYELIHDEYSQGELDNYDERHKKISHHKEKVQYLYDKIHERHNEIS